MMQHTCSYYCERPECIRAQRDELRDRLESAEAELASAKESNAFYRRRCDALQDLQSRMRDPERTIVCDILANGHLLPDGAAGDRYKVMPDMAEGPLEDKDDWNAAAKKWNRRTPNGIRAEAEKEGK